MLRNKPVFNYDLEECNQLFKKGVNPIGCGKNDKTGNVYHVFIADNKYFNTLKSLHLENTENHRTVF